MGWLQTILSFAFFNPLLCVYVGTEPDVHHVFLMMLLLTSLLASATLSINIVFLYTPYSALSSTLQLLYLSI